MNEFRSRAFSKWLIFKSPKGIELTWISLLSNNFLTKLSFTKYFPDSWSTLTEMSFTGFRACRMAEKLTRNERTRIPKSDFMTIHLFFIQPFIYGFNQSVNIPRTNCDQHIEIFRFDFIQGIFQICNFSARKFNFFR